MLLISFESNKLLMKNCKLTLRNILLTIPILRKLFLWSCSDCHFEERSCLFEGFFSITMTIVWWLKQSLIEIARNFWVTKTNKRASLSNLKSTTTTNWMISLAISLFSITRIRLKKRNIPKTWQRFTKVSGNHCSSN